MRASSASGLSRGENTRRRRSSSLSYHSRTPRGGHFTCYKQRSKSAIVQQNQQRVKARASRSAPCLLCRRRLTGHGANHLGVTPPCVRGHRGPLAPPVSGTAVIPAHVVHANLNEERR